MTLPVREGFADVMHELQQLRQDTEYTESGLDHLNISWEGQLVGR